MDDLGSVGSVFVDIGGRLDSLNEALGQAVPLAEKAGESAGSSFSTGFIPPIKQSGDAVQDLTKGLSDLGSTLSDAGGALALVGGVITVVSGAMAELGFHSLEVAGDFERTQIALSALLGSAQAGAEEMNTLITRFTDSGVALGTITEKVKLLIARGFDTTEANHMVGILLDSVNALGTGDAGLNRLIQAFDNLKTRGEASMISLNQLARNGIPAIQILAEQLGVSTDQIRKDVQKGVVDSGVAIDALLKGMNQRYGGMTEQIASTFSGMFANIENHGTLAFKALGDALLPLGKEVEKFIIPLIDDLTALFKWFSNLPEPVKEATAAIVLLGVAGGTATTALGGMVFTAGKMIEAVPAFLKAAEALGLITVATGTAETATVGLSTSVATLIGGTGLTGLGAALASAAIPLAAFAAAALVTESNLSKLEAQATSSADAIRKFSIQRLIAEGNTNVEDLQKMGASLDEIKRAIGGADLAGKAWSATNADFGDHIVVTTTGVKAFSFEVQALIEKQKQADAALREAQKNVDDLAEGLKAGTVSQDAYNRGLLDLQKAAAAAHPALKQLATSAGEAKDAMAAMSEKTFDLLSKMPANFEDFQAAILKGFNMKGVASQMEEAAQKIHANLGTLSGDTKEWAEATIEQLEAAAKGIRDFEDQAKRSTQGIEDAINKTLKETTQLLDGAKGAFVDLYAKMQAGLATPAAVEMAFRKMHDAFVSLHPEAANVEADFQKMLQSAGLSNMAFNGLATTMVQVTDEAGNVSTVAVTTEGNFKKLTSATNDAASAGHNFSNSLSGVASEYRDVDGLFLTTHGIETQSSAARQAASAARDLGYGWNAAGNAYRDVDGLLLTINPHFDVLTGKAADNAAAAKELGKDWSDVAVTIRDLDGNVVMLTHDLALAAAAKAAIGKSSGGQGMTDSNGDGRLNPAGVDGGALSRWAASALDPGQVPDSFALNSRPFGIGQSGQVVHWQTAADIDAMLNPAVFTLGKAAKSAGDAAAIAAPEINQFGESMAGTGDAARKTQEATDALNQAIALQSDQANALQAHINDLYDQMRLLSLAGLQDTEQFRSLQAQLQQAGVQLTSLRGASVQAGQALGSLATAVTSIAGTSASAATDLTRAGAALAGVGAVAGGIAGALARFADLGPAGIIPSGSVTPSLGGGGTLAGFSSFSGPGNHGTVPFGSPGAGLQININGGTFSSSKFVDEIGALITNQFLRLQSGQRI